MNIPKAIETLTPLTKPKVLYNNPKIKDAVKLGIEALKRHKDYPLHTLDGIYQPLPGETKD